MLKFIFIFVLSAAAVQEVSKSMTVFNKKCPAPGLCDQLGDARDRCEANNAECAEFVGLVEKLLPTYDCLEEHNSTTEEKWLSPAIFLCDRYGPKLQHENAVHLLSKLKFKRARQVFGSKALQNTLDGHMAEEYLELSLKAK